MTLARVYPLYVNKLERKGRSEAELLEVMEWLTGYSSAEIEGQLERGATFQEFFENAALNPLAGEITGSICGVKIQEIEDPLVKQVRYLDKLVDELAKGRPMQKVLRGS